MTLHMDEKYQKRLKDIIQGSSNDSYLDMGLEFFLKRNTREGVQWMLKAFDRFLPIPSRKVPGRLVFLCPTLIDITLFITRTATTVSIGGIEQVRKYDVQNSVEERHALVVWLWNKNESRARRRARHERAKMRNLTRMANQMRAAVQTRAAIKDHAIIARVSALRNVGEPRQKHVRMRPSSTTRALVPSSRLQTSSKQTFTFPHRPFKPSPLGLSSPNIRIDSIPQVTEKTASATDLNMMEEIKVGAVEDVPEQESVDNLPDHRRMEGAMG